jgi:hypothetical protein
VIVVIARRTSVVPWTLAVFAASLAALALLVTARTELRPIEGWLLVALLGGGYVGRVMRGYLLQGHRSLPDPVATVGVLALAGWSRLGQPSAAAFRLSAALLGAYLAAALVWSLSRILGSLRRHWVWVNHKRSESLQRA